MTKIISVHSFRGGTGKSNTTANLATLLAIEGKRVGIVDTDIQSPGIHVLFNLDESEMVYSLNDYLWGKCEIQDTAKDVTDKVGTDITGKIFMIPASMKPGEIARVLREGYDMGLLNDGFRNLIVSLELDFLIIDTHAGLSEETVLSIAISNAVVIIMCPDNQSYQGTAVMIDTARKLDVPRIFLVVNKIPKVFDLEDLCNKVESVYDCKVTALMPLSDEMAAIGSSKIFSLQYPNHEITLGLKKLRDEILKDYSITQGQILAFRESYQEPKSTSGNEKVKTKESLASFDLEIAKILPENANNIFDYAPLGISCAALAFDDKNDVLFWQGFPQQSKQECQKLVWDLMNYVASGYTLLTWNGCNFDFRVLAQESGMYEECGQLALNHIDLMLIVTFTKGWFLGLDKALSGAGISGKVKKLRLSNGETLNDISGALAPVLWAKQEYQAVLTYLKGDVVQTLELAKAVQDSHAIHWVSENGKSQSVLVPRLLTAKECFSIPKPDTSWMKDPPQRETFVEWIPNWEQKI